MGMITSIYETTGALCMHIKGSDNVMLIRHGEFDSIARILQVGEMYNENIDCKILTSELGNLRKVGEVLNMRIIICFEFMDKHVFILNSDACKFIIKKINGATDKNDGYVVNRDEYTFISKELVTEIKGGIYETEKELMDSMR